MEQIVSNGDLNKVDRVTLEDHSQFFEFHGIFPFKVVTSDVLTETLYPGALMGYREPCLQKRTLIRFLARESIELAGEVASRR